MESFSTLQGEGFFSGTPAHFIRTAGCDVGCHWCDVKESWEIHADQSRSVEDIVQECNRSKSNIVVVTGGEPLMFDLDILTRGLRAVGKSAHLETSGVYHLTGEWDWICFSPKKFRQPLQEFYEMGDELKVVIYHRSDLQWAADQARQMNPAAKLFLQPEWSQRHKIIPLIVDFIKNNPSWRISLQTHKYMDIP